MQMTMKMSQGSRMASAKPSPVQGAVVKSVVARPQLRTEQPRTVTLSALNGTASALNTKDQGSLNERCATLQHGANEHEWSLSSLRCQLVVVLSSTICRAGSAVLSVA